MNGNERPGIPEDEARKIGVELVSAARFLARSTDPEVVRRAVAASGRVYAAALERGDLEVAEAMADSIADAARVHPELWDDDTECQS